MSATRRLYRSVDDRRIAGVAGGLAEYFSLDATIVRLALVGLAIVGPGIILYLLMWAFVPRDPIGTGERPGLAGIVIRAIAIVLLITIVGEFTADLAVLAFGVGLLIGLFYLWRNLRSEDDDLDEPLFDADSMYTGSDFDDDDRRLYRSAGNRKVLGVFGGLAEMFNLDPTLVRVVGAVLIVAGFPISVGLYFIYAYVVPEKRQRVVIR